jgi:tungstate transport system substrate-binding protein
MAKQANPRPHWPRRRLLRAALALPLAGGAAAQQRASLVDPLRLGVDRGLAEAGLAAALVRAFGLDTGIAVKASSAPVSEVLLALERGEIDVSLTDHAPSEIRLVEAGLAHDRREAASAEFVLVGPAATRKQPDPAAVAGGHDVVAALRAIHAAQARFVSAGDGWGAHLLEQALWRAAQLAPAPPWHAVAGAAGVLANARAAGGYAIVERGAFASSSAGARAGPGTSLAVLVDRDPRLTLPVQVMRSFRSAHPAAKLFVAWVSGPKGRRAAARLAGFR